MPVFKTTITVTVLSDWDSLARAQAHFERTDLAEIVEDLADGIMLGNTHVGGTVEIAEQDLKAEQIALGNDGSFFDTIRDDR